MVEVVSASEVHVTHDLIVLEVANEPGLKTYEFLPATAAFLFFSQLLDDAFAREAQQKHQETPPGAETRQEEERRHESSDRELRAWSALRIVWIWAIAQLDAAARA